MISLEVTISIIVVLLCLYGCSNTRVSEKRDTLPEEFLFQRDAIDSIVRLEDELFIYSAKYDTVIHETGIFTDLHLDYSLGADELLVGSLKKAIQLDASNQREEAEKNYLAVIARFKELQNIRYLGDSNGYWHLMVNRSIMVSYAYEQLEDLENAIEVLKPHLANPETYGSEIIQRYISLCIDYYGLKNVQNEFRKASETFAYVDSTYYKFWGIEIFGAHLDLKIRDGYEKEKYFIDQAISGIRGYELLTSFFELNLQVLTDKHEHQSSLR